MTLVRRLTSPSGRSPLVSPGAPSATVSIGAPSPRANPSDRGRGAGGMVLDALIAHARAHGATRIWCNARVPARRSYERAGFGCVSAAFELHRIGPHVVMELC